MSIPTLGIPVPRRPSFSASRSAFELSGAPAASFEGLPSAQGLADLELVRASSRASLKQQAYKGGGGLELTRSRNPALPLKRIITGPTPQTIPESPIETSGADETHGDDATKVGEEQSDKSESAEERHTRKMYERFSERHKSFIVAIVAYAALLAPFSSSSFLPSIPSIVADLNTSPTVVNASIAIFIITLAIFPLAWAPYAGLYGRRPIYILSLPIFSLGSLGVALSPNLTSLIITRIIQGIGSSAVLSVGAGTIGDLYERERRGQAMGLFYLGILVGPATAPALAGVLTEYVQPYNSGWRAMQYLLFAMGVTGSLLVAIFLPETSHLRGVDVIREERRAQELLVQEAWTVEEREQEQKRKDARGWARRKWEDAVIIVLNPLAPLKMLVHPHILAMSLNSSFVLMSTYTILVPLAYTLAPRYNITNAGILGTLYLASGFGNITATRFTGQYADYVLAKYANGHYSPEHRLYAALIGGGIVLPVSVLAVGWVIEKGGGTGGLVGAIIFLFLDGVGLMMVLTPTNTYCVDVMQSRSAEVIAVNNFVRYMFSAGASAFVLPLVAKIGVGWTNTLAAGLCWIGFGLVLLIIRYGERMRAAGVRWEGLPVDHVVEEREKGEEERTEGKLMREKTREDEERRKGDV